MADDKRGRDKQAQDADRRQRERALQAELERYDEAEPPIEDAELDELEAELETVSFPATGAEIVDAVGERRVTAGQKTYAVEELLPEAEVETFEAPEVVRSRIQRPTVASAMKRIVEASETIPNVEFSSGQRDAYEKTIRALQAVDTLDEDEGVRAITDWIIEQIEEKGKLPESRDVRRQGAKITRNTGYEVRSDEWLGI
ncbi:MULTISPECIES: DUF5789 family protein [Halolamina]|uniref:Uncharacterized protein n=1 Tax=Halolamina pelagica TaxID=699431 RepID=A0A1I5NQK4_9EURY|nr:MULTISPECIES: hypothetical protein [Halolamina]NHX36432.1 hypothetical protein [Halolamina sp. R1-12]SFP24085.1 hypothetical protein SAMN05216277_102148 [Halolamina pelagica]